MTAYCASCAKPFPKKRESSTFCSPECARSSQAQLMNGLGAKKKAVNAVTDAKKTLSKPLTVKADWTDGYRFVGASTVVTQLSEPTKGGFVLVRLPNKEVHYMPMSALQEVGA